MVDNDGDTDESELTQAQGTGFLFEPLRQARRLLVAVFGGTIVGIGVIMLVTPGPALIVIPIGLAVLATEFVWARRLLKRMQQETADRIAQWRRTEELRDEYEEYADEAPPEER